MGLCCSFSSGLEEGAITGGLGLNFAILLQSSLPRAILLPLRFFRTALAAKTPKILSALLTPIIHGGPGSLQFALVLFKPKPTI